MSRCQRRDEGRGGGGSRGGGGDGRCDEDGGGEEEDEEEEEKDENTTNNETLPDVPTVYILKIRSLQKRVRVVRNVEKARYTIYVGSSPTPNRRLRQHRGELVGGAKRTRRQKPGFDERQWQRVAALSCDTWEKLEMLGAEARVQNKRGCLPLEKAKEENLACFPWPKRPDGTPLRAHVKRLLMMACWKRPWCNKTTRKAKGVPVTLTWFDKTEAPPADTLSLPDHVTVRHAF